MVDLRVQQLQSMQHVKALTQVSWLNALVVRSWTPWTLKTSLLCKTQGPKFAAEMEAHVREYDVDIMNLQRVSKITGADQTANGLVEVELENGAKLESKTVILSTGARWREMNVPGEAEYRTRGVAYRPHCDGPLFKGKRVAVIGGGNSGVEAAIDLAGIVEHVTLVEFDTKLRADQVLQNKLNSLPNTTVIMNALSTEVLGDGS